MADVTKRSFVGEIYERFGNLAGENGESSSRLSSMDHHRPDSDIPDRNFTTIVEE